MLRDRRAQRRPACQRESEAAENRDHVGRFAVGANRQLNKERVAVRIIRELSVMGACAPNESVVYYWGDIDAAGFEILNRLR